jgi:Tfp pilus assembly protein PilF
VQFGQSELQQPEPTAVTNGFYPEHRISTHARVANAHYLAGLGYVGLKDQAAAKTELSKAVQLSPGMVSARAALSRLE